jgi:hypothetical protein
MKSAIRTAATVGRFRIKRDERQRAHLLREGDLDGNPEQAECSKSSQSGEKALTRRQNRSRDERGQRDI